MTKAIYAITWVAVVSLVQRTISHSEPNLRKPDFYSETDAELSSAAVKNEGSGYTLAAEQDMITDLPGLDYNPGFNQFSGYLTVDEENERNIFYWYVESMSDPTNDPVIFWTNGGPGCSGLMGFGTEFGPYIIHRNGTLSPNEYTWNKVASIFYVEQPAGVGFSYSNVSSDYNVGDSRAASDNFRLIQQFFERFPERKTNDFFISSESFGGHYIPNLTLEIFDQNRNNEINFRGFLLGNPYVDPYSNYVTEIETRYMHGTISGPAFFEWSKSCKTPQELGEDTRGECDKLVDEMLYASYGIDAYGLDYPLCVESDKNDSISHAIAGSHDNIFPFHNEYAITSQSTKILNLSKLGRKLKQTSRPFGSSTDPKYRPCGADHLTTYLNNPDVQKAIHANPMDNWSICTDKIHFSEDDSLSVQTPLYAKIINETKSEGSNFKMMIYSGDDDSVCCTAGTQSWIYNIGVDPKEGALWIPWKYDKQTAGFTTEFNLGEKSDSTFTFVTVHGAGHEVPSYKPAEALAMFESFFTGDWNRD